MSRPIFALVLAALLLISGIANAEMPSGSIEALVQVLKDEGLIDDRQAGEILERQNERDAWRSWLDRIRFSGDMRSRWEGFWYDEDPVGNDPEDRQRLRYRFRLGIHAEINSHIDANFRLATGNIAKSRNQTLGRGLDFDPDSINVDLAYVAIHPFAEHTIPFGGRQLDVMFGKMPNLFRSKVGKDLLIWDGDLTPEGIAVRYAVDPCDCLGFTLNGAYFVVDENSLTNDPHLLAVQLQTDAEITPDLKLGTAISYYGYGSVDGPFTGRGVLGSVSRGNIAGGISDGSRIDVGDLRAYARYEGFENWPLLLYGNVVHNFSAERIPGTMAGKEDLGWSIGLEIGDKKQFGKLGVGYFVLEANAVPANFTDSDIFDGRTNGKGWTFYGARRILRNTDIQFEVLVADALDKDIWNPVMVDGMLTHPSLDLADRIRVRTDLVVSF